MHKYQEALDDLVKVSCVKKVSCAECDINKICNSTAKEYVDTLQQLVDKATPKKPHLSEIFKDEDTETIYDEDGYINETICVCPNCGKHTIFDYEYSKRFKYCSNCAQAIDWSDEDAN